MRSAARALALLLLLASCGGPASAAGDPPPPSPGEIVAAAPDGQWIDIAPEDLLVMTLAPDGKGRSRRILIQLMPPPLSAAWVANIRLLARARWYDGTAVTRVQDNYVVQWGDPEAETASKRKPLPPGLRATRESDYVVTPETSGANAALPSRLASIHARHRLVREMDAVGGGRDEEGAPIEKAWQERDSYADWADWLDGWPIAGELAGTTAWPVHCYGMVGVGRDLSPDAGTGAELYTVIGQAPRHLDRNIALVGRIVEGMEHLSSLPRGTGQLGFYETPGERTPILSVRLASELPAPEQPHLQMLATASDSFERYAHARANRRDPFFIVPAGSADVCNIPVPIRRKP